MDVDAVHPHIDNAPGPPGLRSAAYYEYDPDLATANLRSREGALAAAAGAKRRLMAVGVAAEVHDFLAPRDWTGVTVMGPDLLAVMVPEADIDRARCVLGDPSRPVTIDPSWLTSDVLALARSIHDEQAFDQLPILADALQDAGCEDDQVLAHCRGEGPHVRGCWVVEAILERG